MSGECFYVWRRAVCAAFAVLFAGGAAQATLVLDWQYSEATADIGQSETVVFSDYDEGMSAMAEVEDAGLGSASAELEILQQVDALDVWTVDLSTAIDLSVNEDAGGAINFARGETYFQLAVIVSDVPYAFDLEYEFDEPSGPFITNAEHFVCQYGSGSVLYPRAEPYILLWGGMDYTVTGLDSSEWGYLCAHAETNVTLSIEPVPEPITLSLLAVGGLAMLRRRRKA